MSETNRIAAARAIYFALHGRVPGDDFFTTSCTGGDAYLRAADAAQAVQRTPASGAHPMLSGSQISEQLYQARRAEAAQSSPTQFNWPA